MERNSAPGWRHGDESYRRKLHSRRGNDDDAKTKGACDFLLPIQTSQKMVSTDDGWLLFSTKKNPKGSLPLTRNHTISSAACLRVFFVFFYRALCDVIWQFHSTFPFLIFYFSHSYLRKSGNLGDAIPVASFAQFFAWQMTMKREADQSHALSAIAALSRQMNSGNISQKK